MTIDRLSLVVALIAAPSLASAAIYSGEIRAKKIQIVAAPLSPSLPVVLRMFAPDGAIVEKGELVASSDAGDGPREVHRLQIAARQSMIEAERSGRQMTSKFVEAEINYANAVAARDTAKIDADLPANLVSELDFDRFQGEYRHALADVAYKDAALRDAKDAISRSSASLMADQEKLRAQLQIAEDKVAKASVRSIERGFVVHAFDELGRGDRFEEGSSAIPGAQIGWVIGDGGGYTIHAWALEVDSRQARVGLPVLLKVDAYPKHVINGTISSIGQAAIKKPEWGRGRYIELVISPDKPLPFPVLPGMSVTVDTDIADASFRDMEVSVPLNWTAQGSVFATKSVTLTPPDLSDTWQLTVAKIIEDGTPVKKGDVLLELAALGIDQQVSEAESAKADAERSVESSKLELDEQTNKGELAVESADAELEKASRKAAAPKGYIPGVEYKKLQVALKLSQQIKSLTVAQVEADTLSSQAALKLAQAKLNDASDELKRLASTRQLLTVRAEAAGIFLRKSGLDGRPIGPGDQVIAGQSIAEIATPGEVGVRVDVQERDIPQVKNGTEVLLSIPGKNADGFIGTVSQIGGVVHGTSRFNMLPVVSITLAIKHPDASLKPGQRVVVQSRKLAQ